MKSRFYVAEPTTASPTVNAKLKKLNEKQTPAKVNLPALARRDSRLMSCIKPADIDHVFISSDFSSLEPSITAQYSQDPYYRYATCDGIGKRPYIDNHGVLMIDDIYLMTASVLPGLRELVHEVFTQEKYRDLWMADKDAIKDGILKKPRKDAKPACLGFNYGMGPKRFVAQSFDAGNIVTLAQAKGMYKAYWDLYRGIAKLVRALEIKLKKTGAIENPFGYRLTTEPHKGYNAFIQSSASGVVDILCLHFFPSCPWAKFVCLIHDEVVYTVPKDKLAETKALQDKSVAWVNETLQFEIPMRLGFCEASTWAEMK